VLILHHSSSLISGRSNYDNWNESMLWFASAIVQAFRISPNLTQIGLLKSSDEADIIFHLYNYTETDSILDALQKVDIDGGYTNIAGALQTARTEMFVEERGARADVRRLIFLITDDTTNIDNERTQTEAQLTRDAGIEVFTIAVTSEVDKQQLEMIVSYPPESYFYYVSDFQMLNLVVRNLTQNACLPRVTITTTPTITTTTATSPITVTAALLSFFLSSMRGRQQLSCPVLRPPSGPNARPQDNMHLT